VQEWTRFIVIAPPCNVKGRNFARFTDSIRLKTSSGLIGGYSLSEVLRLDSGVLGSRMKRSGSRAPHRYRVAADRSGRCSEWTR
jgi:hypothetical protein